jgi:hypothetical protein
MRDTSLWGALFGPFEPTPLPIEHVEECAAAPATTGAGQEVALRYAVASMEHWLDLNA